MYKILINGLIITQCSNKSKENCENLDSFTRLFLDKYSMNNIINALYDFISERDEINIFEEKKEENKIDIIDEESIIDQSLNSIDSSVNKKKKNMTFLNKKRKPDLNEDTILLTRRIHDIGYLEIKNGTLAGEKLLEFLGDEEIYYRDKTTYDLYQKMLIFKIS